MSDSEDDGLDWAAVGGGPGALSADAGVLKRGEKDHAPDGTMAQQGTLQRSRDAMYGALSRPASSAAKHLTECDWDAERGRGIVRKLKGTHFKSVGWAERTTTYVQPEELIYLVQRGSMVCFYNNEPLAVDAVMALVLPCISNEFLLVYMHLKRLGYAVRRHYEPLENSASVPPYAGPARSAKPLTSLATLVAGPWLPRLAWRPFYTSYNSIYRDLQWVSAAKLEVSEQTNEFDFYVWKPSSPFKRSRPPAPDFRMKVVSADMPMPELSEIGAGMAAIAPQASTKRSAQEKMYQGVRSFVYAVVDNGVVSFVRMSDSPVEPLYG